MPLRIVSVVGLGIIRVAAAEKSPAIRVQGLQLALGAVDVGLEVAEALVDLVL